jgi:hypothetical protein
VNKKSSFVLFIKSTLLPDPMRAKSGLPSKGDDYIFISRRPAKCNQRDEIHFE